MDLVTVATLLGHQRLETTAIYTTPSGRDLEKAVSKLERDHLEATNHCASAFASSPGRDVVRRLRTASSASDSSIESTAPSRRTTPAADSEPTGSSSCRSIRQASACAQVTETSVDVLMAAASHSHRTNGVRFVNHPASFATIEAMP